jgi:hypothetical protein
MRKNILIFPLTLLLACGIASCGKNKEPETTSDLLIGNWKKIKYATDDDANGQIDSWEIHAQEGNIENELVFNKDSTGVENHSLSPSINFTWLAVVDSLRISRAGNQATYHISSINSANLTLTTNTTLGIAWYLYERKAK